MVVYYVASLDDVSNDCSFTNIKYYNNQCSSDIKLTFLYLNLFARNKVKILRVAGQFNEGNFLIEQHKRFFLQLQKLYIYIIHFLVFLCH